jgi:bifunctional UDP-N-acetylglucosamine pyrophosphorylase/glucosamine-1-phosphate N-acetyltransferase
MEKMQQVSIVILAAGLGTRMRSRQAKVLHRAGGLALIEHVIESALRVTAPERVVAVIGHQADAVRRVAAPYHIRFAVQTEQLGTGHAALSARAAGGLEEGRILICYGDCPLLSAETMSNLLAAHAASGAAGALITTIFEDPTGYGRIIRDAGGAVARIVEEKAATPEIKRIREANSGIYSFDAAVLWQHLARIQPNPASGEIYLTDMAEHLHAAGLRIVPFELNDPREIMGINTRVELAEVDALFRARKARELMLAGVTLERPETVSVDVHVAAGMDTVVEPGARLLGATRIGAECRIGAGAVLQNAVLGDGVTVGPYSVIVDSEVAAGAAVGPFARLRMGAVVEAGAAVGNFVELKKTRLGAGAKAMHLAYLGDAQVGARVNVGAGTITCNYDGVEKHPTVIGADAFVGSNSTLVAPVEVAPDSYVAAGSVITENVPAGALALGRARQTVKEGWVAQRRKRTK